MSTETIFIINFNNESALKLARQVRSMAVYSEIVAPNVDVSKLDALGIIYSAESQALKHIESLGKPILVYENKRFINCDSSSYREEIDVVPFFVKEICKAKQSWKSDKFIEDEIIRIRKEVGSKKVLCALSGGLDSSVVATLLHKAVGDQLVCLFVDHGLLRKGEAALVDSLFKKTFKINLIHIDASTLFLKGLKGVADPEQKRKIIGKLFIDVFEQEATKLGKIDYLAQGTLYSDVIESINQNEKGVSVKSHHNVGGLPEKFSFKLLEPLRNLFKDEVRLLAKELNLPDEIVYRHPFPGPALAVRCIGEVNRSRLETLREVDAIFTQELKKWGFYNQIWQALATLLPVKSVGLKEGKRKYEEVCTIRAVISEDAMQATCFAFPPQFLSSVSTRICTEVEHVSRVLYDITDKPPGTIEWE
jgi:GMP synthase (glutamine-hydrolysing)